MPIRICLKGKTTIIEGTIDIILKIYNTLVKNILQPTWRFFKYRDSISHHEQLRTLNYLQYDVFILIWLQDFITKMSKYHIQALQMNCAKNNFAFLRGVKCKWA